VFDQRTIRRRRAVLAVFVGLSVALLTAYFGEPQGGVLHALQRGTQAALAPIETGASRALKPVRDLFGWFGDTITAKHDNKKLRNEVQDLRSQLAEAQTASHDNRQLRGLVGLQREANFPHGTDPVGARVIARSPTVWYSSIKIDKGSSDGIRVDQPVIAAGGLAGKVANVTGGTAEITLITDADSAVSAQVMPNGATGIVRPEVGNPNDMLLDFVQKGKRVTTGTTVVTSGFQSDRVRSIFPRGIPIGRVTKVDLNELELYQRVHIRPFADVRRIDFVQVLTRRPSAQQNAAAGQPGQVPVP
jgi:rod shape-determining protein MreC